jgi:hypothetical protein
MPGRGSAPPRSGWSGHPNLRRRPHAPNRGLGRLQVQIRRAFLGHEVRSSAEIFDWTFPRRRAAGQRPLQLERYSVWRVLMQVAEVVGRAETRGRPWLWRLRREK